MPSTNYAYVNGKFVPEQKAVVSIFDPGFLYGDGCFETMRVYAGHLFRPLAHMDRLLAGLDALGIESPFSPEELRAVCRALIRYNEISNGVARLYRTRTSIVATVQAREFTARSIRAMVSSVCVHPQLANFKTANRLPYLLAQREAEQAGADDAVLVNGVGRLVELTTSNLFIVKKGELLTPPLSDGALPGITRDAILMLAAAQRVTTHETGLTAADLGSADEVFATNSLIEVAPVVNWGKSQRLTAQLHRAYQQLVRDELAPITAEATYLKRP